MKYYAYILKSVKDNRFYYGSTNCLERRLLQHNSGLVKSTKNRRPLILVGTKEFNTRDEALKFEMFLKKCKNREFVLKLIDLAPSYRG